MLADAQPDWHPERFEIGCWSTTLGLVFPSIKLLGYRGREADPEADPKPFATLVLAHLAVQVTRSDPEARYHAS